MHVVGFVLATRVFTDFDPRTGIEHSTCYVEASDKSMPGDVAHKPVVSTYIPNDPRPTFAIKQAWQ